MTKLHQLSALGALATMGLLGLAGCSVETGEGAPPATEAPAQGATDDKEPLAGSDHFGASLLMPASDQTLRETGVAFFQINRAGMILALDQEGEKVGELVSVPRENGVTEVQERFPGNGLVLENAEGTQVIQRPLSDFGTKLLAAAQRDVSGTRVPYGTAAECSAATATLAGCKGRLSCIFAAFAVAVACVPDLTFDDGNSNNSSCNDHYTTEGSCSGGDDPSGGGGGTTGSES